MVSTRDNYLTIDVSSRTRISRFTIKGIGDWDFSLGPV